MHKKNRILKVKASPLELEKDFKPTKVSIDNMDKFEEKEVIKKRMFTKKHLVLLVQLLNYLYSQAHKKQWMVLKANLLIFLKQTQPRVIVNQHVSEMCIEAKGN